LLTKNLFKVIVLLLCSAPVLGQSVDSLKQVIEHSSNDTVKINALAAWDNLIYRSDPELDVALNQQIIDICGTALMKKGVARKEEAFFQNSHTSSLDNIAQHYKSKGEIKKALDYYQMSADASSRYGNKKNTSRAYSNIALVHYTRGALIDAIKYLHLSLTLLEELEDKKGVADILNNIGIIYDDHQELDKALEYYSKSLALREEIGDKKGIATSYNNMGKVFNKKEEKEKTLSYFHKALAIKKELGDQASIALALDNFGSMYMEQDDFKKSEEYYLQSLKIKQELGDKQGLSITYRSIGTLYNNQSNTARAIEYGKKSMQLAEELNYQWEIRNSADLLRSAYEKQGNLREAYAMYKLYIQTRDTIVNQESERATIKQGIQYDYEKARLQDSLGFANQKFADSLEFAAKEKVKDLELSQHKAESEKKDLVIEQEKTLRYALFGGLFLVLLFAAFLYNRFRLIQKQKTVIETQKQEVEHQKELVDERNKEVLDSITYAKRLQDAILPPTALMQTHLPESFILFKPKDLVSGDFYWIHYLPAPNGWDVHGDTLLFAAADCTGHGVPGALVSVVCSNALNRTVKEFGIVQPDKMLNMVRDLVIETFEDSEDDVKDGMDISLCSLNTTTLELKWAGANNPLWVVSRNAEGEHAIKIYKANKQAIGKTDDPKPFELHTIQLQKGDTIFIFSDGFADQFGGIKGKKFKYKPFRELLVKHITQNMEEQHQLLDQEFENWRGNFEQVDDVCVIGVRV
jgi:serine phosphatase RsbU (regulator of sigma subunit)